VDEIVSDDLNFEDSTLTKIFEEFKFTSTQGGTIEEQFFIRHSDPSISSITADLLSDPTPLSRIWLVKQTFVEDEEMKIPHIVDDTVLKFKSDKIKEKIRELLVELKAAVEEGDEAKILALQKRDLELKKILRIISKNLGDRIVL